MYQAGQKLQKRPYIIESIIGQGGFGITYKARHLELDFPVVLKTPNANLQRDREFPKYVDKFKKEGKILAKISCNPHPNIVRVSDLFEEDGIPWLVMDYIPGENLYNIIWDEGILAEDRAITYIRQIAEALKICHEAGIVHKDAHPGNVILRKDSGIPVLIDFGLAGNVGTENYSKSANPSFAPWEQILKGEKAPTVDIYTLAASLYYFLTSEIPVPCLVRKIQEERLIPAKHFNPSIRDEVNLAILKGMEVEPKDRPQSVDEWLKLLISVEKPIEKKEPVEIDLLSEVGVDYKLLENLLAKGSWREADIETRRMMLKAANREKEGWFRIGEIDNFPCADLRTIDQLWVEYSGGHFGFSVQKKIWGSFSTGRKDEADFPLSDVVGWRQDGKWLQYDDLVFDLKRSPRGHLPASPWCWGMCWAGMVGVIGVSRGWGGEVIFSRINSCNL